eukprot:412196-Rhodomonas_salina.1
MPGGGGMDWHLQDSTLAGVARQPCLKQNVPDRHAGWHRDELQVEVEVRKCSCHAYYVTWRATPARVSSCKCQSMPPPPGMVSRHGMLSAMQHTHTPRAHTAMSAHALLCET